MKHLLSILTLLGIVSLIFVSCSKSPEQYVEKCADTGFIESRENILVDYEVNDDSSEAPQEDHLDDWMVYFASSSDELPDCDSETIGRLYYIETDSEFQVCKSSGWQVIDVKSCSSRVRTIRN